MGVRARQCDKLRECCKGMPIVALQEVHGTMEELKAQLYLRRMDVAILASTPEHAAGGVAFIIPEMTQEQVEEGVENERIRHSGITPGRAQRVAIKARGNQDRSDTMLVCYNVHNFGLSSAQVNQLVDIISAEVQIAMARPDHMTALVMGDINYPEVAPTHLHVPLIDKGVGTDPRS
eukprot:4923573-Pyramimonas_sp.AAC.1